MRTITFAAATIVLFAVNNAPPAGPAPEDNRARQAVLEPELRQELLNRVQKDQTIRKRAIKPDADEAELKEMINVDRENTARLKEVIERYGWPGKALVGDDGAHAAWLLVQHADLDPAFQKKCLELLKAAVNENDASPRDLAYLTDRVLVGQHKPQIYGTQLRVVGGTLKPQPIEDEEHVDDRRKEVGLSTLREYLKASEEAFLAPKSKP